MGKPPGFPLFSQQPQCFYTLDKRVENVAIAGNSKKKPEIAALGQQGKG